MACVLGVARQLNGNVGLIIHIGMQPNNKITKQPACQKRSENPDLKRTTFTIKEYLTGNLNLYLFKFIENLEKEQKTYTENAKGLLKHFLRHVNGKTLH